MNLRKIDALIFKNIFDKPVCDKPMSADLPDKCSLFHVAEHYAPDEPLIPHYSSDISAAFEVVAKFEPWVKIECGNGNNCFDGWKVYVGIPDDGMIYGASEVAETLPLAICKAALKCKDLEA
jgi:hypothetical protein